MFFNNLIRENQTVLERIKLEQLSALKHEARTELDMLKDTTSSGKVKDLNKPSKFLFKIDNLKLLQDTVAKNHPSHDNDYRAFYDDVTSESSLISIDQFMSFADIIEIAHDMFHADRSKFYGMIVTLPGGQSLNPLNPIIADHICNLGKDDRINYMAQKCKVVFYSSRKNNILTPAVINSEKDNWLNIIVIKRSRSGEKKVGSVQQSSPLISNGNIHIDFALRDEQGNLIEDISNKEGGYYIVPLQKINKNIIAPFYGALVIRKEGGHTTAAALTKHMTSANVSRRTYLWTGICTGSLSKDHAGFRGMNDCNHKSPMTSKTISTEAWNTVVAAIDVSLMAYSEHIEGVSSGELNEPLPERCTFQEFTERKLGTEVSEYVEYIKSIKLQEIQDGK